MPGVRRRTGSTSPGSRRSPASRDVRRATAREANELTGFAIGGIPPIGHRAARSRVIMDPDLGRYATVWAAAGLPTAVFAVPPATLRMLSNATSRRSPRTSRRGRARPAADGSGRRDRPERDRCAEPRNATITYPGGLRARWRWGGSGQAAAVFALSEAGGTLVDLGPQVAADPDALCRAELRVEGPRGAWTARFASTIHDEPRGAATGTPPGCSSWRTASTRTASSARPASRAGTHRSATPILALLGVAAAARTSLVQAEIETFAIEAGRRRSPGGSPTPTS